MQTDKTKMLIIVLIILFSVIFLLGIIGIALYLTTDMFKSDEVLFQKYIAQNVKEIADVIDVSEDLQNISFLQQNDYNKTANVDIKYSEKENDQEEVYNIKEEAIVSNASEQRYRKIKTTYNDETILDIGTFKQQDLYGVRLSNIVRQFVCVENKNIGYFISSLGYNGDIFAEKLEKVDISDLLNFTDEEIESLTNTYANAIFQDISKQSYSSKANVMRTLNNGQSITANTYTLTISKNDLDKIYKRILSQAINDEIILTKIRQIDAKIRRIWN